MDKDLNDKIMNTIENEIDKASCTDSTDSNDASADEVYIKLDPIENIEECTALAIEANQIHYGIMHLVKLENAFSEKTKDMSPEQKEKIFTDECRTIYNKKSLLLPYIEKVITSMLEDPDFNYVKKLPKLLLMASYYKKKKNYDPNHDQISYYKLTEVNEDGEYVVSKNFEKVIKAKSVVNIDFSLDFLAELWTKRMTEKTSFEVLKKKIQKFLKTQDCMEDLKMQINNYLAYQEQLMKEKDILRQHVKSKHTELQKG